MESPITSQLSPSPGPVVHSSVQRSTVPIKQSTTIERGRHHLLGCASRIDGKIMLVACVQRQLDEVWLWLVVLGCKDALWISVGTDWWCCSPSSICQSAIKRPRPLPPTSTPTPTPTPPAPTPTMRIKRIALNKLLSQIRGLES